MAGAVEGGAVRAEVLARCAPDLADSLTAWARYLKSEKNASRHTQRAYGHDVSVFVDFIAEHFGRAPSLNDLSEAGLRDFRAWQSRRALDGAGAATRARGLSGVKNFLRWLDRQGIMHNAAIGLVRTPKLPHKLPRPLYEKQARELLENCGGDGESGGEEGWTAQRDRALLTLLYGCGLRIDEALSLDVRDMPRDGFLRVIGKGRRERQVPVLAVVEAELKRYLSVCPFAAAPDRPLFLGARGGRMNQGVAQRAMRMLRRQIGLAENATPHALRHSFATHLLQNGANLREIQEMLGHASLRSTQRYTEVDAKALLDSYRKAHPRNRPDEGSGGEDGEAATRGT